jgi:ZIP family zinc transporter
MNSIPLFIQAGFWGGLAGSSLLIGALIGYYCNLNQRIVAAVMAFGSGALISALSFELIQEAYNKGGLKSAGMGFIIGALVYTAANYFISQKGAKHRKRSNLKGKSHLDTSDAGALSIAMGAFIDGIPESLVIGLSIIDGGRINLITVLAIFISNIPEGLSSSAGMKNAKRSKIYIFSIWGIIALTSSIVSSLGYTLFKGISSGFVSAILAVAAGAILSMVVDTMIPEAFEETHDFAGLITAVGFLSAFILSNM